MGKSNLVKAIELAADKHRGMFRKGDKQPYIYHPLEVLNVASLLTDDEEVLCAAVLHDTLEDTDCTKEELLAQFSPRVVELVANESEDKRNQVDKAGTWLDRKKEAIDTIKNAKDIGTKIVCLADKISNLRSFNRLVMIKGDDAWNNFNMKDPKMHYWYFNELKEALKDLEETSAYKEYCFLVDALFSRYIKGE